MSDARTPWSFDRIFWSCVVALWLTLALLGAIGWAAHWDVKELTGWDWFQEVTYRTILLFLGESSSIPAKPALDNWPLQVSRVFAPLIVPAAVVRVGFILFDKRFAAWRISKMKRHTVVCGLGHYGAAFARSERMSGQNVVAIESDPTPAQQDFCHRNKIRLLHGDCTQTKVLEAAAADRALRLIACTGDDNKSLVTGIRLNELIDEERRPENKVTVFVSINAAELWRQISRSDSIVCGHSGIYLWPFSLSDFAARRLLWNEPVYSYADLRHQPRIHLVLVGFDDFAEAILARFLPGIVYRDFPQPRVTILSRHPDDTNALVKRAFPEIKSVAEIMVRGLRTGRDDLDDAEMAGIESDCPVTAIFVCRETDQQALQAALYIRESVRRHDRWNAPIYVRMSVRDGVTDLVVTSSVARRFSDVIQVFGTEAELCTLELLQGPLEKFAEDIHDEYQVRRRQEHDRAKDTEGLEPDINWCQLPETYRESNRRAADHIKAKLASAGCWVPAGMSLETTKDLDLVAEPEMLDALASLEHLSWCAGRYINGWRIGPRDNQRKFHNDLVGDFYSLDERTKDYDRDQVRMVNNDILTRDVEHASSSYLVRRDLRIGLVGDSLLSPAEAQWCQSALFDEVIPNLRLHHGDVMFTFVSALSPGPELIMAATARDYCRENGLPCRFLIVEGMPEKELMNSFKESFALGGTWDGSEQRQGMSWVSDHHPSGLSLIKQTRDEFIAEDETDWVINLHDRDTVADLRRLDAKDRTIDYMAGKCQILVAVSKTGTDDSASASMTAFAGRASREAADDGHWPSTCKQRRIILLDPTRATVSAQQL